MRTRRLLIFAVALMLSAAAFPIQAGHAKPQQTVDLSNVQSVLVEDDWEGLDPFTPYIVHADFTRQHGAWNGTVLLSISDAKKVQGQWTLVTYTKTAASTIPNAVMQKVLDTLYHVPMRRGKYTKSIMHTDDNPHPTLTFATPTQTVSFHSDSNTEDKTPWQVTTATGIFVTHSAAPDRALSLLKPYLHENLFRSLEKQAMKSR